MSQFKSPFQNTAFQQASSGTGFNLVTQNNNFSSVFDTKPLEGADADQIETLLSENFLPIIPDYQVKDDIARLKQITAEIKAIGRQSIILLGERVNQAGELMKLYRDGTFTRWIETTFGNRKMGYNALSYYSFYSALPSEDLRQKFKRMPQKPAYILASRKHGSVETKAEIVREYHSMNANELVALIQEKIPNKSSGSKRENSHKEKLIAVICNAVNKLQTYKDGLSSKDKLKLTQLVEELSFLRGSVEPVDQSNNIA